jgi:hypothetical protein
MNPTRSLSLQSSLLCGESSAFQSSTLLRILREPHSEEAISSSDALSLLASADFPADLLRVFSVGGSADCAASVFIGLLCEINADGEFKRRFIESGFLANAKRAYEQRGLECPLFARCSNV